MTSYRLFLIVFFLACPLVAPTQADEVDTYAAAFIDKQKIPGLSLAVVRDGKLVKAAGYGFANLELSSPATAETAWERIRASAGRTPTPRIRCSGWSSRASPASRTTSSSSSGSSSRWAWTPPASTIPWR
jgi:hypothetical protein